MKALNNMFYLHTPIDLKLDAFLLDNMVKIMKEKYGVDISPETNIGNGKHISIVYNKTDSEIIVEVGREKYKFNVCLIIK